MGETGIIIFDLNFRPRFLEVRTESTRFLNWGVLKAMDLLNFFTIVML